MHLHLYEEFDDVSGVKSRFKEIVAQVSDVVTKGCMDPTCARARQTRDRALFKRDNWGAKGYLPNPITRNIHLLKG